MDDYVGRLVLAHEVFLAFLRVRDVVYLEREAVSLSCRTLDVRRGRRMVSENGLESSKAGIE